MPLSAATIALAGCSADTSRKFRHADNLPMFVAALAGYEHQDIAPVRIDSGRPVRIVSAHAVSAGSGMRIFGSIERVNLERPAPGAHLDVALVSANGKILARTKARYSQTMLEHHYRGGPKGAASFSAHLPSPPTHAHVEVIHHDAPMAVCHQTATRSTPAS